MSLRPRLIEASGLERWALEASELENRLLMRETTLFLSPFFAFRDVLTFRVGEGSLATSCP